MPSLMIFNGKRIQNDTRGQPGYSHCYADDDGPPVDPLRQVACVSDIVHSFRVGWPFVSVSLCLFRRVYFDTSHDKFAPL